MNNILKQIARALYQIVVVGIILLPFRIVAFIGGLLYGLMTLSSGKDVFEMYYSNYFLNIRLAYSQRAYWVKYGDDDSSIFDEDETE